MGDAWLATVADRRHRWLGCRETCLQVKAETLKWLAADEMQVHTLLVSFNMALRGSREKASSRESGQVHIGCPMVGLRSALAPM